MWTTEEIKTTEILQPPNQLLIRCLSKSARIVRTWGKQKTEERRKIQMQLHNAYTAAQLAIQSNPQDSSLQGILHGTVEALQNFEFSKAEWADFIIEAHWIADGEKYSHLFCCHSNSCLKLQRSLP